ncbi:MAG: CRISPR-associated endonuclease Cas1 [Fusobacteriia bacterium 4572_132]|nr:MAG: CRISPR-associated endonuclease Cas1 [Fusobacteriia bacterium 4572_132]
MKQDLYKLEWYKITANFVAISTNKILLTVFQSIIKKTYTTTFPNEKWKNEIPNIFFHIKNKKANYKFINFEKFPVEIIITNHTKEDVIRLKETLIEIMKIEENNNYYKLESVLEIEARNLEKLEQEESIEINDELCIEFLSPFPVKYIKGKHRTHISKKDFIKAFENRLSRLFNKNIKYNSNDDDFTVIPYYWNYVDLAHHNSQSQKGHKQYINGCIGKIYIKGNYSQFLKLILLGSELHTSGKLSFSHGYYYIHKTYKAHFTNFFPSKKVLFNIVEDIYDNFDDISIERLTERNDEMVDVVYNSLKEKTFHLDTNQAFRIKKKSGLTRTVEKLNFKDMIVSKYILKITNKIFDRVFEDESIGFRKGVSREKVIEMIKESVELGYIYLVESDIEDFFSSINHIQLKKIINKYLPKKDLEIKEILYQILDTGYIIDGNFFKRERGLPQGNPLSPMLANLYLDDFDEYIKEFDVKFIRYGDDFIILTKSLEEARNMLSETKDFLEDLKLKIKSNKTSIKNVNDGFDFLGYSFIGSELNCKFETVQIFKKPLYIVESYLFLSLEGEHVNVYKNRKIILSVPLRRISEIIMMSNTTFSTALIRKCIDFKIPITTTLNTGYFVTTIKPDTKEFFDISYFQRIKYDEFSEGEKISFAKEIAVGKLNGYKNLFKSKYQKGTNVFLKEIDEYILNIDATDSNNSIMGYEGKITKEIFKQMNGLINNNKFHLKKRKRRNPDMINSMLNFSYYMLFTKINTILRSLGLNPFLGFLHSHLDDYESLVADLEEFFRADVDKIVIRMINLNIIGEKSFNKTKRGAYLTAEGKKKFINYYEGELLKKRGKNKMNIRENIYRQCLVIKGWSLGKNKLFFYKQGENK